MSSRYLLAALAVSIAINLGLVGGWAASAIGSHGDGFADAVRAAGLNDGEMSALQAIVGEYERRRAALYALEAESSARLVNLLQAERPDPAALAAVVRAANDERAEAAMGLQSDLLAFLAGLPAEKRAPVIRYLARHDDLVYVF